MARMKWDADINWRELNDAEYSEEEGFEAYDGPLPPSNIVLDGDVTKIWATKTNNGDDAFKALFVAAENEGEKKKYNGLAVWEWVLFTNPAVKFKWQAFFNALGVTLAEVKAKTLVEDEEGNQGRRVTRIGNLKLDEPIPCRIKTQIERSEEYGTQCRAGRFLALLHDRAEDDDDDTFPFGDDEDTPF